MTVSTESASLRDKPQTAGAIPERLPRRTRVTVKERVASNRWARVAVHIKEGYIDVRQLSVSGGQSQGQTQQPPIASRRAICQRPRWCKNWSLRTVTGLTLNGRHSPAPELAGPPY